MAIINIGPHPNRNLFSFSLIVPMQIDAPFFTNREI
jgi:hypothetical protein